MERRRKLLIFYVKLTGQLAMYQTRAGRIGKVQRISHLPRPVRGTEGWPIIDERLPIGTSWPTDVQVPGAQTERVRQLDDAEHGGVRTCGASWPRTALAQERLDGSTSGSCAS